MEHEVRQGIALVADRCWCGNTLVPVMERDLKGHFQSACPDAGLTRPPMPVVADVQLRGDPIHGVAVVPFWKVDTGIEPQFAWIEGGYPVENRYGIAGGEPCYYVPRYDWLVNMTRVA